MPRRRRAATFVPMVRLIVVVAAMALGAVLLKGRLDDARERAAAAPQVSTAGVPSEFAEILASRPDPVAILRHRGALPGLGAISRLTGRAAEEAPEPPAPFADVGSRRE